MDTCSDRCAISPAIYYASFHLDRSKYNLSVIKWAMKSIYVIFLLFTLTTFLLPSLFFQDDSNSLYKLGTSDSSRALNANEIAQCVQRQAGEIAEDLRKLILKLYGDFLSSDGRVVDYKGIGASKSFEVPCESNEVNNRQTDRQTDRQTRFYVSLVFPGVQEDDSGTAARGPGEGEPGGEVGFLHKHVQRPRHSRDRGQGKTNEPVATVRRPDKILSHVKKHLFLKRFILILGTSFSQPSLTASGVTFTVSTTLRTGSWGPTEALWPRFTWSRSAKMTQGWT